VLITTETEVDFNSLTLGDCLIGDFIIVSEASRCK
jgi:hypothetical protein